MAYAETEDLSYAAGGTARLLRLTDHENSGNINAAVLARAQDEADAWIDSYARRLYGERLPFDPVPRVIRDLAAAEAIFRLKQFVNDVSPGDISLREQRLRDMKALEAGTLLPVEADPYPIAEGGGTPVNVVRDSENDGGSERSPFARKHEGLLVKHIKVTEKQLTGAVRGHVRQVARHMKRALKVAAREGKKLLKESSPNEIGFFKRSWKVVRGRPVIANDAPYAGFVERGMRPRKVTHAEVAALHVWVMRHFKRIKGDLKREAKREFIVRDIVKRIEEKGIRPTYFVKGKLDALRRVLGTVVDRELVVASFAATSAALIRNVGEGD